jgi:fructose-1,6-bisphosphatase/inositol monophosphatase family enzyme
MLAKPAKPLLAGAGERYRARVKDFEKLWSARLKALCDEIRAAARDELERAASANDLASIARVVHEGAGDVTYALDVCTEDVVSAWLRETARHTSLSLLTEDAGWRHYGPGPRSEARELDGFDHGGPRFAIDPVDGTRNLMTDLRPAWTVVSFAGPGRGEPRLSELSLGLLSEIPNLRAAEFRRLTAQRDGPCMLERAALSSGRVLDLRTLSTGIDARADNGYFSFFRYMPDQRPALARVEADFFERLARHERADVRTCWDDQYISSGGQLALLAMGTYRLAADLRAFAAERRGTRTVPTKPYDLAGAVVCARAAGCVVNAPDGSELDFPIDCQTHVSFVGWVNDATRARLEPHFHAALDALDA